MSAFGQRTFSTAIVMSALQFDCEKPLQPAFEETALVSQINLRRNEYAPRHLSGQEHPLAVILVVEDEPLLNLNVSDALSSEGYEVIAVTNADDAIKALEFRNDIHTIFTDIHMPGSMDGLKLAAAVRDRWPPVNIIVTTGMKAPSCDKLPANSIFIAKPYRNDEVLEAVHSFE